MTKSTRGRQRREPVGGVLEGSVRGGCGLEPQHPGPHLEALSSEGPRSRYIGSSSFSTCSLLFLPRRKEHVLLEFFSKKALQRSLVVCPTMPCYAIFQRCGYPTCGMLNRKARKRAVNIRKRFSIQNPRSKKKVFGRDVHMIRFSPSLGPKCFQRPRRGSGSVSISPK